MLEETRICQNCKQEFVIEPEDFAFYEKIKVPAPTFCPKCRMERRMIWRNERVLYKAICGLCGVSMISMYDPKNTFKVYCEKCWWGDAWDPIDYGFSYDFDQPFFLQWQKLLKQTPLVHLWKFNNVDCDYINYATDDKNCYLSASILGCENIFYSYAIDKSQDSLDSLFSNKISRCYENIDSVNNYNSIFLQNCSNCINSAFLFDCVNCQECFFSSNLRNKKYFFKNVQYSKSEYDLKISEIKTGSYSILLKTLSEFQEFKKNSIHRYIQAINEINCSGNNVSNSKNVKHSFNVYNAENIKYTARATDDKDCMDLFGAVYTELAYESVAPSFQGSNAQFSISNRNSHNIKYSLLCNSSHDIFGCIGLKDKQYCVFNKQYTKKEYEALVLKIIGYMKENKEYGEFFPKELSPFAYNETVAQDYFPLTKDIAISKAYAWKDYDPKSYNITKKSEDLPDSIEDSPDSVLNEIIQCAHNQQCNEQCTKAFKIVKEELNFYKKMKLPLPRLCPNCRHYQRLAQCNPMKLWHRKCMKEGCYNEFETSYAPDRPEIVYCESFIICKRR